MADEWKVTQAEVEAISNGDSSQETRVTHIGVEALRGGRLNRYGYTQHEYERVYHANVEAINSGEHTDPFKVYHANVEVLRSIDLGEHTDPFKVYHANIEVLRSIDLGVPYVPYVPTKPEKENLESNPYRPFIPDELIQQDPVLYDFLKEQIETLRRQHNVTQAGDTTFNWDLLVEPNDEAMFTLGSIGRFYHPVWGLLVARYVRFDRMVSDRWLAYPMGRLKASTTVDWVVTNDLARSDPELLLGMGYFLTQPVDGQFGWVVTQGANLMVVQLSGFDDHDKTKTIALGQNQGFVWAKNGCVGTTGVGKEIGKAWGKTTGYLIPPGTLFVDVEPWSVGSITKALEGPFGKGQESLDYLDVRVSKLENDTGVAALASQVKALQAADSVLSLRIEREAKSRASVDAQLLADIKKIQVTDTAALEQRLTAQITSTAAAQGLLIDAAQARADAAYALASSFDPGTITNRIDILEASLADVSSRLGNAKFAGEALGGDVLVYDSVTGEYKPRGQFSGEPFDGSIHGAHIHWRVNVATTLDGNPTRVAGLEFNDGPGGAFDTTGGTPTASDSAVDHGPELAFDGDETTYWEATTEAAWLAWEFPEATSVGQLVVYTVDGELVYGMMSGFTIEYSDDGVDWVVAWTVEDVDPWVDEQFRKYPDPMWDRGAATSTIDWLGDVDTSTVAPVESDVLTWDGTNWVPEAVSAVDSVFGRTGIVEAAAGDYTAAEVDFVPAGSVAATDVQTAVEEIDSDLTALDGSLATVAKTGAYADLSGRPTLGTMAAEAAADYIPITERLQTKGQAVIAASVTVDYATHGGYNLLVLAYGVTVTLPASGWPSGSGFLLKNVTDQFVPVVGATDGGPGLGPEASAWYICDGGTFWRSYSYSPGYKNTLIHGAQIMMSADTSDAGIGTTTPLPFDMASFDTDGFWNPGNPTRLTVPAGFQYAQLTALINIKDITGYVNGWCQGSIRLNGADWVGMLLPTVINDFTLNLASSMVPVTPGDYFDVRRTNAYGSGTFRSNNFLGIQAWR